MERRKPVLRAQGEAIKSVHKAMIYCGVIILPRCAVKGSYTNVYGLNRTHSDFTNFGTKESLLHKAKAAVCVSLTLFYTVQGHLST